MMLFHVTSISGRQEGWDCENLQIDVDSVSAIPEDTLTIIESTCFKLIKQAFQKHIANAQDESNGDWWDFDVASTECGFVVTVGFSINGENKSIHEIELSENETFNEQIKPILNELNIARIEIEYSGGGDSGGTDRFELLDKKGSVIPEGGSTIENWFEVLVWDHVGANFNDSGSQGNASLDCTSNIPTIICEHADFFDDSKSFEEVFAIDYE